MRQVYPWPMVPMIRGQFQRQPLHALPLPVGHSGIFAVAFQTPLQNRFGKNGE